MIIMLIWNWSAFRYINTQHHVLLVLVNLSSSYLAVEYYESVENGYYSSYSVSSGPQNLSQQQAAQYNNQNNQNFQRLDIARNNNSAFVPIKDGSMAVGGHNEPEHLVNYVQNAFSDDPQYQQSGRIDYSRGSGGTASHNDSDELEINELFNIIDQGTSTGSHVEMLDQQKATGSDNGNRSRPMSVSVHIFTSQSFSIL